MGDRPVPLTATEYDLLRLLTLNAGRVSTYELLIRPFWNGPDAADPDRVRTFVKYLRRKLGDDPDPTIADSPLPLRAPLAPGSATVARNPPSARFASTMSPQ